MNFINGLALATFLLISVLFFIVRWSPILFHLICALLISGFVFWTGRILDLGSIANWILLTVGLILYWFGLVIVRVMLTRSVSLWMLSNFDRQEQRALAGEGIASRLKDARHFGLVVGTNEGYRLTPFGRLIGTIVAISYRILRIK